MAGWFVRVNTKQALTASLVFVLLQTPVGAEDAPGLTPQKAVVAVVGEVNAFNIGQEGYCGARTAVDTTTVSKFRIPANQRTFFFIRSKFHTTSVNYTCEGDFSFVPEPGLLHMIRYSFDGKQCILEVFRSAPGATPEPMAFVREELRSCLGKN